MNRHLAHLCGLLVLGSAAISPVADAACSAGHPNAQLSESTPSNAFTNNGDGTVTHTLTGLIWKRCVQGLSGDGCDVGTAIGVHWREALVGALADRTAGRDDWRVPNVKELESIVETCGAVPAINQVVFPASPLVSGIWTSTTFAPNPSQAWEVGLGDGHLFFSDKVTTSFAVRLVRGGNPDSFDATHRQATLDIDGNGTAEALSDGLLVLRYLFGLRGTSLIQGAIAAGATRVAPQDIENQIRSMLP